MRRYLLWFVLLALPFVPAVAQNTCPALVEEALDAVGSNCAEMDRNSACYGYNLVGATFTQDFPENYFTQPADQTALSTLRRLETFALDTTENRWGVAIMNLQANIPDSLPGQAVTFVLLGDVQVENAVEPDDELSYSDPITVTPTMDVRLFSDDSPFSNTLAIIPAGDDVTADGISETGEWVRVVYDGLSGWISVDLIETEADVTSLPVLDGTLFTPMQAFYLRTGIGQSACEEAPEDVLMVQSPDNLEVDLTVNGADIRVGSTILIRILPPGDVMEIIVLEGRVEIKPSGFNPSGVVLYAGQRSTVCLSDPDNLGADGEGNDRVVACSWSPPQYVRLSDLAGNWCGLEQVPLVVLLESVDLPCEQTEIVTGNTGAPGPFINIVPARSTPEPEGISTPEPPPPAVTPEVTPGDPNDNHCFPGGDWGDGRCNNPDNPALTNWYWTAGWYLVRFDDGRISWEDLPEQYQPATPEPEPPQPPFTATWFCSGPGIFGFSYQNLPPGTTSVNISYFDTFNTGTDESLIDSPPGTNFGTQNSPMGFDPVTDGVAVAQPSGAIAFINPSALTCP